MTAFEGSAESIRGCQASGKVHRKDDHFLKVRESIMYRKHIKNAASFLLILSLLISCFSAAQAAGFTQLGNSTGFSIMNAKGNTVTLTAGSVSDPGSGECWEYANRLYSKIWGTAPGR